jgi:DNA-binding GntR family transcriptional regulator
VSAAPGTTQQHAVDWLRRAIVAGELQPGARVTQEDIAERIGVSVVPVREALRVLEGEGQVTYRPRRGYFVTTLHIEDLVEIYELRRVLEAQTVRRALPDVDAARLEQLTEAADECSAAAEAGDVARELAANRRFHFALFEHPAQPHALRVIRLLWDSTEAYRALYYNAPEERRAADDAHRRILAAVAAEDADRLVAELDAHRDRALRTLTGILA